MRLVSLNLIKHLSSPCRAMRHSSAGLLWMDMLGSALEHWIEGSWTPVDVWHQMRWFSLLKMGQCPKCEGNYINSVTSWSVAAIISTELTVLQKIAPNNYKVKAQHCERQTLQCGSWTDWGSPRIAWNVFQKNWVSIFCFIWISFQNSALQHYLLKTSGSHSVPLICCITSKIGTVWTQASSVIRDAKELSHRWGLAGIAKIHRTPTRFWSGEGRPSGMPWSTPDGTVPLWRQNCSLCILVSEPESSPVSSYCPDEHPPRQPDGFIFPPVLPPAPRCVMALPPSLLAPDSLVRPARQFQTAHSFLVD